MSEIPGARHEHDAAGCLDCDCKAAPWSSAVPCSCPWTCGENPDADCEAYALDPPCATHDAHLPTARGWL